MQRKSRSSGPSTQPSSERKKSDSKQPNNDGADLVIPVESLTCPILAKIGQAFHFAKKAVYARQDGDLAPGSRIIKGKYSSAVVHQCGILRQGTGARSTGSTHGWVKFLHNFRVLCRRPWSMRQPGLAGGRHGPHSGLPLP